jgi:hypothetical protein
LAERNLTDKLTDRYTNLIRRLSPDDYGLALAVRLMCAGLVDIADALNRIADVQEEMNNRD